MNRSLKFVLTATVCAGLSACSAVSKVNPFHKEEGPSAVAAKGERIPVLALGDALQPSEALKGVEISLPAPQPVAAWPLPGGTPEQAMENVQAAPAVEVAWKRDIGDGSSRKRQVTAPPVAVDGRIFTMDGVATVTATDAKSGSRAWRVALPPPNKRDREAFGGGLAVADGKVFVTSGFRFVAALDSATGKVLWRKPVESPIHSAPTVYGSRVYAIDVDNQIIAFDAATGDQAWSYQAIVEPARILKATSPAISEDTVVAPFSSGELIALRAANGGPQWSEVLSRTNRTNALSEIRDIPGRPVIYKGDVFAAGQSGVFAAVALRTGSRRWDLPVASIDTPWPAGDVVYVVSKAGELVAVNRDNGQVYWVKDLNKGRKRTVRGMFGLNKRVETPIWTGPLMADNRLLLANNWGELAVLDAKTGERTKSIKLGQPAYIAPIAYNGMVYLVTDKAELVAIR
jgi:outer membrane protein assembly factor BamB